MKRTTPVFLTAFSVFVLSFSAAAVADTTDSDGFIVFEAQTTDVAPTPAAKPAAQSASTEVVEQTPAVIKEKKPKAKKKVVKKAKKKAPKRAKRATRQKRATRTTRAQRAASLKRAKSYRVRRGDTLYRISVKSGVSMSRLVRLNKLQGSKKHNIQAGQRIRLR